MGRMLKPGVLLVSLFCVGFAPAQTGTIYYADQIKTEVKTEGDMPDFPGREEMMKKLAEAGKSEKVLYFNKTECVYQDYEKTQPGQGNGHGFYYIMIKETVISFQEISTHILTESRDIMDKTFIVTDTAEKLKWKVTADVDTVAGYRCMKAVAMRDTVKIQAWFTTEIPVSIGPANYYGLPGIILKMDLGDGKHTIEATKVDLTPPDPELLKKPKKGKKVTRAEYDKIQEEKMKERMELEGDSDGKTTIRMKMH